MDMRKNDLTVVDLFCGCGGLSQGFIDAGYKVLLGIDNDKDSLETFQLNHDGGKALNMDLSDKKNIAEIKKELGGNKIDVVVGGPPCQGFSLTGPRNFDDKRNTLYLSMIDTIKELRPKAFLLENVPGLATMYGGVVKDEIIKRLTKLGYNVSVKVLCAADYGVPQMRKRVVFIGLQKKYGTFEFPKPEFTPDNYVTCGDAISDLPNRKSDLGEDVDKYATKPKTGYQKMMRKDADVLYNHVGTRHTDKVKSVISLVPEGGNHKDLPEGVGGHRKFNEAWTRYHSKKPSKTVDTGHRNHFHYKYDRVPTVRENARLQSFRDDLRFLGTKTSQNRQVGNAVPPLLGYHLAKELIKYIK
jgi:DNA (cytosine-5)-methyltransferase 1